MRAAAQSSLNSGALMVGTGTPSLGGTIELTKLAEWRRILPPLAELSAAKLRTIEAVAERL